MSEAREFPYIFSRTRELSEVLAYMGKTPLILHKGLFCNKILLARQMNLTPLAHYQALVNLMLDEISNVVENSGFLLPTQQQHAVSAALNNLL